MKYLALIAMSILSFLTGCSCSGPAEGGLYYTHNENGSYSVLKILKIDDSGMHIRLYSNQFLSPPDKIDESALYMAGMNHKPNEGMGMGHLPLSEKAFEGWHAIFIQQSSVKPEELEGYNIWLENKGGYFK